jgi:two-component system sensor histidine kinase DctS
VPYWPPEQYEDYQERLQARLQGIQPPREGFESVFVRKGGSRFPVLIIEAPLINAQGIQTGWMTAFLDISEQRRIEEVSRASRERLQATARLATVGEMASMLSHELNQPLAAIASYANGSINMLRAGATAAGPMPSYAAAGRALPTDTAHLVAEGLHHIADQAQRAGKIIKSVHDFVRRRERMREVVPVRDLFDAVWPLIDLQARKLGVRCHLRADDDLPPLLCDRTIKCRIHNACWCCRPDARPRAIAPRTRRAGWSYRSAIPAPASHPTCRTSCSRHFSPPRTRAWAWA